MVSFNFLPYGRETQGSRSDLDLIRSLGQIQPGFGAILGRSLDRDLVL